MAIAERDAPRAVRWDSSDEMPVSSLLEAAGWAEPALQRVQVIYNKLRGDAPTPTAASIAALLEQLGVAACRAPHFVRAMVRPRVGRADSVGGGAPATAPPASAPPAEDAIGFEDFLLGLVAADPTTAHAGVWNGLRAQYIFRQYDADRDGVLSLDELSLLTRDVHAAYGRAPLTARAQRAEASLVLDELGCPPQPRSPAGPLPRCHAALLP